MRDTSYNRLPVSDKLQSVLNQLVDNKTGLIKQLVEIPLQAAESGLYIYSAECSDTRYAIELKHSEKGRAQQLASGAALDPEEALWSTVGEACERYIASYFFIDQTIYANQKTLGKKVVPLEDYVLFSDEQYERDSFRYHRPDANKEIYWAEGYSLDAHEPTYLPAQMVWLGFPHKKENEVIFTQISTGLATGATMDHAVLTGLREVVERDAFTTHWLLKNTPKKIRLDNVTEKHPQIASLLKNTKLEIHLLWMQTDLNIPCVTCVIRLPKKAGISVGMSCHLDSIIASEKAIVEALHTYNWILEMRRSSLKMTEKSEITDFEHHIRYYFNSENHQFLEFLLDGEYLDTETFYANRFSDDNYSVQLKEILKRIKAAGYESYAVDISKSEFTDLDIFAAKAVIPGLQPLHVGLGVEYLDTKRLEKIAKRWNITFPETLNLEPHPFP